MKGYLGSAYSLLICRGLVHQVSFTAFFILFLLCEFVINQY